MWSPERRPVVSVAAVASLPILTMTGGAFLQEDRLSPFGVSSDFGHRRQAIFWGHAGPGGVLFVHPLHIGDVGVHQRRLTREFGLAMGAGDRRTVHAACEA